MSESRSTIQRVLLSIPRPIRLVVAPLFSLTLYLDSGLLESGWFKSWHLMKPVDRNGNPIPWFNYPVIHFLDNRLNPTHDVFEYGSGSSTVWFADRVNRVVSVEHDPGWAELVASDLPENAAVYLEESSRGYARRIHESDLEPDVVVVDGRWRNECVEQTVEAIGEGAVIVLDNSDRDEYEPARKRLVDEGFDELPYRGMAALLRDNTSTSIFYRENNCFDI